MNYASLVDQIKAYANRSDSFFVAAIPNFINQGINRIYYQAKDIGFEKQEKGLLFGETITLPLDWRETISLSLINISLGKFILLDPRSYEFTLLMSSSGSGVPEFYSQTNYNTLTICPSLSNYADWGYLLVYLGLPLFNEQNPVNFLTERYPNLLLYSCLMETIPYLKDDGRIGIIREFYKEALESVNDNSLKVKIDRTINRDVN